MQYNKVQYSTASGLYCTTHDVKVPPLMLDFSSINIINHCVYVKNDKFDSGISYDMIIFRDLMVELGMMGNFKLQILKWDFITVYMKETSSLLGKYDLNKREIREVVMQTAGPASTLEATDRLVKILDVNYANADLNQGTDNATYLNAEERTQLLILVEYLKDLFDGTLVYWATKPVDFEI